MLIPWRVAQNDSSEFQADCIVYKKWNANIFLTKCHHEKLLPLLFYIMCVCVMAQRTVGVNASD